MRLVGGAVANGHASVVGDHTLHSCCDSFTFQPTDPPSVVYGAFQFVVAVAEFGFSICDDGFG